IPPERNPRCLACHAHAEAAQSKDLVQLADGVDCETCHGPANAWLECHKKPGWVQETPWITKRGLGMTQTEEPATAVRLCTRCHVGEPGREVDHELIAAGHPRLNFELTSYLANLPRHWDDAAARKRQSDLEARHWILSQIISAGASLELLRARAQT